MTCRGAFFCCKGFSLPFVRHSFSSFSRWDAMKLLALLADEHEFAMASGESGSSMLIRYHHACI